MNEITRKGYAFIFLIVAIVIDVLWGNWIMDFARTISGDQSIIIQLSVTICLAFMTFVIPLLIFTDKILPHPKSMLLGLGSVIIGIPLIMIILAVIVPTADLLLEGTPLMIINMMTFVMIIIAGFGIPIWTMIQGDMNRGAGE